MRLFLVFSFIILINSVTEGGIIPQRLTCEYLDNPMVMDVAKPRLSWINIPTDNSRNQSQSAWQIRVAGTRKDVLAGNAALWNSGKVASDESVNILYNGLPLVSQKDYWWQVRVWDNKGEASDWSEPAFWATGFLKQEDWKAKWIGAPWQGEASLERPRSPKSPGNFVTPETLPSDLIPPPAPMMRKSVNLKRKVVSARAYVTGLGFFEFYVNGKKVSDDVLTPNLTLYGKRDDLGDIGVMIKDNFREYRVMYLCYDIMPFLKKGENVLGAILGNGFYNPASYWTQGYGSPRFLAQIHIKYNDGTESVILTDESWKVAKSPVIMDLIYDGEHYDARLEQDGWSASGFDDSGWENAMIRKAPEGKLVAHMSPTDRVMESISPVSIELIADGHYKVDFGQEISGWLKMINFTGEEGRKITVKYVCESHMGSNSYTMRGGSPESYSARFTWFVFREVEITNWPGELTAEHLRAEAVYTNVETTGKFDCSNQLFNKINAIWWRSQTDNMHGGIASDCPHRERSPYTGDGQVACVTVMHNFDSRAFYRKWIRDILGAQNPDNGYVPNGAPWQPGCGGGVAWGAAINIMPWEYYLHYGDTQMLSENYEGMKGYISYMLSWTNQDGIMHSQAPDSLKPNRWLNLGDWVAPGNLPPDDLVHTFYLWRCSDITAKVAGVLGLRSDELKYSSIADKTAAAFHRKFYDKDKGTYGKGGGNIFALKMGIPEERKSSVLESLKADIEADGGHLDTGIFGTQFFFEVLTENGLNELAFEAMNKRTQPGFGWWIEQGATTTWEQWSGKGSRNHPMFGGGIVWLYRKLAGMNADPDQPGYRNIIFCPEPAGDVSYASYSNLTPYGNAGIAWRKENNWFFTDVEVPVGSTAIVHIPSGDKKRIMESGVVLKHGDDFVELGYKNGYVVYRIGSGKYSFESEL